jgi:hypothetical protein
LLIQHIGKTDRETMQQRVLGSTGIVASCRASFCLFADKETGHRTFAPMKNNLAVKPTSVVFDINSHVRGGRVEIIDWMLEKTADDIAGEMREAHQQNKAGRKPNESTGAENWLYDFLSNGRKPVGNKDNPTPGSVRYESKQEDHSWRSVERGKKSLDVVSKKDCGVWFWSLPNLPDLTEQDRQNTEQDRQDRQNTNDAYNSNDTQDHEFVSEIGEGRQNVLCTGNSGGLGQNADFVPDNLNNVLNSNDDSLTHERQAVPLQPRPKRNTGQQSNSQTESTSCRQENLF